MRKSFIFTDKGIRFIYLKGQNPYQIGFEHGKLLKDDIETLIAGVKKFAQDNYGLFLTSIIIKYLFLRSKKLKKKFASDLIEEMKGIADGSEQNLNWVILANTIYELVIPFFYFLKLNACSFFIAPCKNSDSTIIGKTTDLMEPKFLTNLITKLKTVFVYNYQNNKAKYLTLSFPLCLCGPAVIFENGPVIAFNDGGWFEKINFNNQPIVPFIKEISNKNKTISQIISSFKKSATMKAYACLLSDGTSKNSFLIEISKNDYHLESFKKYLINTNFFRSPKMIKKSYKQNYQKDIHFKNNLKRYRNIEKKIIRFSGLSNLNEAKEILEIHEDTLNIENGSVSNSRTVDSFIYFPLEKKLLIPNGKTAPVTLTGDWIEFKVNEIFKRN
jgi:hypothetical protein